MTRPVACLALLCGVGSSVLWAAPDVAVLTTPDMEARVCVRTGELLALRYRARDMLSAPATLRVSALNPPGTGSVELAPGKVTDWHATRAERGSPASVRYVRHDKGARVAVQITVGSDGLHWSAVATGPAPVRQATVTYHVPCLAGMPRVFWASAGAPARAADKPSGFQYPYGSVLPLATVYSETDDIGMSAIAPLELRKPCLTVRFDWKTGTLRFANAHLRLGKPWQATTGLWLVPHAGCWRPGLGWLLRRYPDYFTAHPRVWAGEGYYEGCWLRGATMKDPEERKSRGVRWVESHSFWPFYGLYVPDKDPWLMIPPKHRKKAADLVRWEQGREPGREMTRQWIRDYIRAYHKQGIQYYAYVNTNEAWLHYANKYFPDSVVWRNPSPYYGGMAGMNAWETTAWGKHIREQVRRTVQCFPEQDGLFLDQNCHRGWHFGADDGVSMVNGKLCCQIGFSQEQMIALMHKLCKTHNMGIWTNYSGVGVECTRYVSGIMSEAGRPRAQNLQYLCLARPMVICNNDRTAELNEERFKSCLSCGAFPPARWDNKPDTRNIVAKYTHLLNRMKGRRWVLHAHALRLPPGVEGNIFQAPNGDYLVTFITREATQLPPARSAFVHHLPVTVRVPDAGAIKHALVCSGDYRGPIELAIERTDTTVRLTVPAHLVSSMIVLTRRAPGAIVRTSTPVLIRGQSNPVRVRLRDPQAKSDSPTVRLTTPWGTHTAKARRGPDGAYGATFDVAVPTDAPLVEHDMRVSVGSDATDKAVFTAWVEPPASASCPGSVLVKAGSANVSAWAVNHTGRPMTVALEAHPPGVLSVPSGVSLKPYEQRTITIPVRPSGRNHRVRVSVVAQGQRIAQSTLHVRVPRQPRPGDLLVEPFDATFRSRWRIRCGRWACADGVATARGHAHWATLDRRDWRDYGLQVFTKMDGSTTKPWIKSYVFLRMDGHGSFARFGFTGQERTTEGFTRVALDRCHKGRYTGTIADGRIPYRPGEWYVVRVEVVGRRVRGYVDETLIVDTPLPDEVPDAGGIGLGVTEDSMVNHYRHLIVYPIRHGQ